MFFRRFPLSGAWDTSHYPKDVPFEVPQGWVLSTVFEVFQINPKNHVDDSTEAGFVPMTNISDGFEDKYSYEVKPWESIKSGFTHFRNGDIAVAKISPCLENRKSFVVRGLPQGIGAGTTELFVFRSGQIIPEYGLLFFKSEFFISNCVGIFNGVVGQQRVARTIIEEMPFPIPPIAEQIKIVQCVNSIFSMISEVENNQSALKSSVEKSKALILDLAIHGKLVPQDPSEEPAIELLKRINPAFQPSHNLHYEGIVPAGWQLCQLSDLFKITMGQSPDGSSLNHKSGIEFHQGKICFTEKYLTESGIFTSCPTKCAEPNSLLCCVRAPVGVFNITTRRICIGRGLCSLSPLDLDVDIEYWFYALCSLTEYYEGKATGSTFKAISGDIIRNTVIAVPPKMEQKRIREQITRLFSVLKEVADTI